MGLVRFGYFFVFFPLLWALLVLLTRTPVKIIVTPKGAGFAALAGILLAVFSLSPDSPKPVLNNPCRMLQAIV